MSFLKKLVIESERRTYTKSFIFITSYLVLVEPLLTLLARLTDTVGADCETLTLVLPLLLDFGLLGFGQKIGAAEADLLLGFFAPWVTVLTEKEMANEKVKSYLWKVGVRVLGVPLHLLWSSPGVNYLMYWCLNDCTCCWLVFF